MANVKISAAADPGALLGTDMVPLARAGQATAYRATMTEIATFASASAAAGLNNVGRNLLHNGLFNVQQRGVGAFTTGGYTADRWVLITGGDTLTCSILPASDANRADIGDETAAALLSTTFTGGAAAGNFINICQRIESVRRLAGKTITVSFYANAAAANQQIGVSIDQQFGTGGSPSPQVFGNGVAVTLSATPAQFARRSVTITLPSVAGKTFGTNAGTDWTALNFWLSSGSGTATRAGIGVNSGTVNLWGIQLEIGSTATQLEKPDFRYDISNCQRFYQVGYSSVYGYTNGSGISGVCIQPFAVLMRTAPTMFRNDSGNVNAASATLTAYTGGYGTNFSVVGGATPGGFALTTQWAASADF